MGKKSAYKTLKYDGPNDGISFKHNTNRVGVGSPQLLDLDSIYPQGSHTYQGIQSQGMSMQGMSMQGMNMQDMYPSQSMYPQGIQEGYTAEITPINDILDDDQLKMVSRKIRTPTRTQGPPPSYTEVNIDYPSMSMPPTYTAVPSTYSTSGMRELTCREIADHIRTCTVCGKLYENDRTLYIVVIVILVIVCVLLLKRLLEL